MAVASGAASFDPDADRIDTSSVVPTVAAIADG
jgi:hypothetical protein